MYDFLLAALFLTTPSPITAQPAPREVIVYDDFMKQERRERLELFSEITPGNRAALVRTHIQRWLAKNRDRLTEEQLALLEESFRSITPEAYTANGRAEEEDEVRDLMERMAAAFDPSDLTQFGIGADYIPLQAVR